MERPTANTVLTIERVVRALSFCRMSNRPKTALSSLACSVPQAVVPTQLSRELCWHLAGDDRDSTTSGYFLTLGSILLVLELRPETRMGRSMVKRTKRNTIQILSAVPMSHCRANSKGTRRIIPSCWRTDSDEVRDEWMRILRVSPTTYRYVGRDGIFGPL